MRFAILSVLVVLATVACGENRAEREIEVASDACVPVSFFRDEDLDGFGDSDSETTACLAPDTYVAKSADCDDTDANVSPDQAEVCDAVDNDCDGMTDEDLTCEGAFWCSQEFCGVSSEDAPLGVHRTTAVWTGSEMIVWGGSTIVFGPPVDSGGRYRAATDTWAPSSSTGGPSSRCAHTAIWTGTEMIVWGGVRSAWHPRGEDYLNDGFRYDPVTDSWSPISSANAPSPRAGHSAVWTGSEMIVVGGGDHARYYADGARYNPATDSWASIAPFGADDALSTRTGHSAIWTGSAMIIWGGSNFVRQRNDGLLYDPTSDAWSEIPETELSARYGHIALWTGDQMIVWGGRHDDAGTLGTGAAYDPSGERWMSFAGMRRISARGLYNGSAVWTGAEMIVWGGDGAYTGTGWITRFE